MADAIRVLLVDDHQVVRRGLRTFLEVQDDIEVVGEAADGAEGVARARELAPDVILMDVKMPGTDGVEALRRLRELDHPARVLVVTSFTEQRTVVPALRAGAAGYVYEDIDPDALAGAIRSVHAGHVLLQPEVADALLAAEGPGSASGPRGHPRRTGARGTGTDSGRPLRPGDRPRPGPLRDDGEDPRLQHPHETGPDPTAPRPPSGPSAGAPPRRLPLRPGPHLRAGTSSPARWSWNSPPATSPSASDCPSSSSRSATAGPRTGLPLS
ncbi:Protein-glutamate methylesterase/protein-glutamine glutaminase [Streptomyces fumanus]